MNHHKIKIHANTQRGMIWLTLIMLTVYGLGFALLMDWFPPPRADFDAAQTLLLYTAHPLKFKIGIVCMIIFGAFSLPWGIVVATQMARYEPGYPMYANLQLAGAILGAWLFATPPVLWGIAAFSVDRAPELTLLVHEMGWLLFITPVSYFVFQSVSICFISFYYANDDDPLNAFPRWLGYLSIWMGIATLGGVIAIFFKQGPFSWHGLFPFYIPTIVYSIWLWAMCNCMFKAIRKQEESGVL